MRNAYPILLTAVMLIASRPGVEAAAYMKLGDIKGESVAANHEDWIELDSAGFRMSKESDEERPEFSDMIFQKRPDLSTPRILQALVEGKNIPEALIDITQASGQTNPTYLQYKLRDVLVSSYFMSPSATAPEPMEFFSLNYLNIESTYWQIGPDGIVLDRVQSYWDIPENTGGSSSGNEPPTIAPISVPPTEPATPIDVLIVINDLETPVDDLIVTASSNRPDMILDLAVSGTGRERTLSFRTSPLYSGIPIITVVVSDGIGESGVSFAVLVGVEMTPFEVFMETYFTPRELGNPQISSPIVDPDGDDIPTVVEYALLTNPREYTLPQQAVRVSRENTESGPIIRLNYRRRTDDKNVRPIPWMAPESLLFAPASNNPLYKEDAKTGENPFYEDVEGIYPVDPDGPDVHMIRMQVDVE